MKNNIYNVCIMWILIFFYLHRCGFNCCRFDSRILIKRKLKEYCTYIYGTYVGIIVSFEHDKSSLSMTKNSLQNGSDCTFLLKF